MDPASADIYDITAIILSIASGIIAMASLYFSFLKRGQIVVPPVRMYRVDPRTTGDVRFLKITMPLTFMNTGAGQKVVSDLRVHVRAASGSVIFHWREELDTLRIFENRGSDNEVHYPFQPTLNGYESISRVYAFQTGADASSAILSLDKVEGGTALPATIELRGAGQWKPLRSFTLRYRGVIAVEDEYEKLNV